MSRQYWLNPYPKDAFIIHSTGPWKDHKYIRVEGGKYIYPEDQKSGQQQKAKTQTPQQNQQKQQQKQQTTAAIKSTPKQVLGQQQVKKTTNTDKNDDKHVSEMATSVIRGRYGVGEERKKKLRSSGESWERIQNKVNEMLGSKVRHKVPGEDSSSDETSSTKKSSKSTSKRKRSSSSSSKKSTSSRKRRKSSSKKTSTGTKRKRRSAKTMTLEELADYGNTYVQDLLASRR